MRPAAGVYEEEEPEAADSEDDDDLLAAAAAAVEAQEMKSKGKKHLGILGKKDKKDKEQPPAAGLVASPAKVSSQHVGRKHEGLRHRQASPVQALFKQFAVPIAQQSMLGRADCGGAVLSHRN